MLIWPMIVRDTALITVMVSWPLLATKTRLPSGEITMFHGSAPVLKLFSTTAAKFAKLELVILITDTELPAAFDTKAKVLFGSSAMLRGSSPTGIVFSTA